MALRKKKQQQSDDEKVQELLKSWNIQFPETSAKDFPSADFPVSEKKTPNPEKVNLIKSEPPVIPPDQKATAQSFREQMPEPKKVNLIKSEKSAVIPKKKTAPNQKPSAQDLDRLFKKQAIQYMHGTVRMYSLEAAVLLLLITLPGFLAIFYQLEFITVLCCAAIFFIIWYMTRWKLTFEGSTNWLTYETLFHEEIQFHASQIQSVQSVKIAGGFAQKLILTVYGEQIKISLGTMHIHVSKNGYTQELVGGYYNVGKLKEYLNFYQDLHGKFSYQQFQDADRKFAFTQSDAVRTLMNHEKKPVKNASAKEELFKMLSDYQDQIDKDKKR